MMLRESPPAPPRCPRIAAQKIPKRSRRMSLTGSKTTTRARVCRPMQLLHPDVIVCLVQEAPPPMPPAMDNACSGVAPVVPRVCSPLLLPDLTLPRVDAFGTTSPLFPVGRGPMDGGMPKKITPHTGTIVPPLSLPASCLESAKRACSMEAAPSPRQKIPRRIIVASCKDPPRWELQRPHDTPCPCSQPLKGNQALLTAARELPEPCTQSDLHGATKPLRVRAHFALKDSSRRLTPACGDTSEEDLGGLLCTLSEFGHEPTLGFTKDMQHAMNDSPCIVPGQSLPMEAAILVPKVPEPMPASAANAATGTAERTACPRLEAWVAKAAAEALQGFGPESTRCCARVSPPPLVQRGTVPRALLAAHVEGAQSDILPINEEPAGHLGPENQPPIWRDERDDFETDHAPLSHRPVWRDVKEATKEATNTFGGVTINSSASPRLTPLAPSLLPGMLASACTEVAMRRPRSLSPLRNLIRRRYAQCFARAIQRRDATSASPTVSWTRTSLPRTKLASSGKGNARSRRKAVWRDVGDEADKGRSTDTSRGFSALDASEVLLFMATTPVGRAETEETATDIRVARRIRATKRPKMHPGGSPCFPAPSEVRHRRHRHGSGRRWHPHRIRWTPSRRRTDGTTVPATAHPLDVEQQTQSGASAAARSFPKVRRTLHLKASIPPDTRTRPKRHASLPGPHDDGIRGAGMTVGRAALPRRSPGATCSSKLPMGRKAPAFEPSKLQARGGMSDHFGQPGDGFGACSRVGEQKKGEREVWTLPLLDPRHCEHHRRLRQLPG